MFNGTILLQFLGEFKEGNKFRRQESEVRSQNKIQNVLEKKADLKKTVLLIK